MKNDMNRFEKLRIRLQSKMSLSSTLGYSEVINHPFGYLLLFILAPFKWFFDVSIVSLAATNTAETYANLQDNPLSQKPKNKTKWNLTRRSPLLLLALPALPFIELYYVSMFLIAYGMSKSIKKTEQEDISRTSRLGSTAAAGAPAANTAPANSTAATADAPAANAAPANSTATANRKEPATASRIKSRLTPAAAGRLEGELFLSIAAAQDELKIGCRHGTNAHEISKFIRNRSLMKKFFGQTDNPEYNNTNMRKLFGTLLNNYAQASKILKEHIRKGANETEGTSETKGEVAAMNNIWQNIERIFRPKKWYHPFAFNFRAILDEKDQLLLNIASDVKQAEVAPELKEFILQQLSEVKMNSAGTRYDLMIDLIKPTGVAPVSTTTQSGLNKTLAKQTTTVPQTVDVSNPIATKPTCTIEINAALGNAPSPAAALPHATPAALPQAIPVIPPQVLPPPSIEVVMATSRY